MVPWMVPGSLILVRISWIEQWIVDEEMEVVSMQIAYSDCRKNEVVNPAGMAGEVRVVGLGVLLIYIETNRDSEKKSRDKMHSDALKI